MIHYDQVRVMPGRDNTCRALNLIHLANVNFLPLFLLSTDAEKAFDRVSWSFLKRTLTHIGLGNNMLRWINALYECHVASVKANDVISSDFFFF